MRQFASTCQKVSDGIERLCLYGAGALFVVNLLAVMLGVFSRFYRSPIWTLDLAKITLVWLVMLAAAPALKRGEHMALFMLVNKLPPRFRRFVKWIRVTIFFCILALMVILGSFYAMKMQIFTVRTLGISKTIPLLAIPVGLGLMMIEYTLQQFISFGSPNGDSEIDDTGNDLNCQT